MNKARKASTALQELADYLARKSSTALQELADLIYQTITSEEGDEELEKEIKENQAATYLKKLGKQRANELTKQFQTPIVFEKLQYTHTHTFEYAKKREHSLTFRGKTNNDLNPNTSNPLYQIGNIGGLYTADEIKQIIDIVGGTPRAIANRLLGK